MSEKFFLADKGLATTETYMKSLYLADDLGLRFRISGTEKLSEVNEKLTKIMQK